MRGKEGGFQFIYNEWTRGIETDIRKGEKKKQRTEGKKKRCKRKGDVEQKTETERVRSKGGLMTGGKNEKTRVT